MNAETFDLAAAWAEVDVELSDGRRAIEIPAWRIARTRNDPMLFALTYFKHHLKSDETGGAISFGDAHIDWCRIALEWLDAPVSAAQSRHALIAPRSYGKSTWWFLILPMWAAAHGHVGFVAAFADSATQAEGHLETFTRELEVNERLRADYAELCSPKLRANRRQAVATNRNMYQAASGFVFAARGIDSGNLGMKVGNKRPDLLILDDIEPGESGYSEAQVEKRLSTMQDVVFPLNDRARVIIVGTVVMPGSIMHQLVKAARDIEKAAWIAADKIKPHYYPPIVERDDGSRRSSWPGRWTLDYLLSIAHTRSYLKNFANDPRGYDGDYWTEADFSHADIEATVTRTLLSIDPAVTTKKSSDYTGLVVVGYSPPTRSCLVKKAKAVKLSPSHLRRAVLVILEENPEIGLILIEINQGGDTWKSILHHMPVPVRVKHQTVKKEVRAATILNDYQTHKVEHLEGLDALEEQMIAFPKAPNDDLVDAVGTGVAYFLHPAKKVRAGVAVSGGYA